MEPHPRLSAGRDRTDPGRRRLLGGAGHACGHPSHPFGQRVVNRGRYPHAISLPVSLAHALADADADGTPRRLHGDRID